MKRAVSAVAGLALAGVLLAGCGGGSKSSTTSSSSAATTPATVATPPDPALAMKALIRTHPAMAGTVLTVYSGSTWAVEQSSAHGKATAVAFALVDDKWKPDLTRKVTLKILGPNPGEDVSPLPQIAIEFAANQRFTESALWVDGMELQEKGGGTPTDGTIYGAPTVGLTPGEHVAVGFAATTKNATAVAWVFDVPG